MIVLKWLFESPGWLVVKLVRQKVRCTSVCVILFMSFTRSEITLVVVAVVDFGEVEQAGIILDVYLGLVDY